MMRSLPLYVHLLELEASNNSLIRLYEKLSYQNEIKEELLLVEVKERLKLRSTFKIEIEEFMKQNYNVKNRGIVEEF